MFGTIRPYVPWLATSLLALGLTFSSRNPQVKTIRKNLNDLIIIGTQPISSLLKAPRLWEENARLNRLLTEMSIELGKLCDSGSECIRLRNMLDFKERASYRLVAADVVGMNPDLSVRSVAINVGVEDGVEINQAVIVPEGVVGRVFRVGRWSSAVQLLIDPNIGVAGRLVSNSEDGIVHAAGKRRLALSGIPVTAFVDVGDSVITSGLGGIFPSGLLIGCTINAHHSPGEWLWEIDVEPAVDFGRLGELFVVLKVDGAE